MEQQKGMLQEQLNELERQLMERDKDFDMSLLIEKNKPNSLDPTVPMSMRLQDALDALERVRTVGRNVATDVCCPIRTNMSSRN
jgi:hypothetical protein